MCIATIGDKICHRLYPTSIQARWGATSQIHPLTYRNYPAIHPLPLPPSLDYRPGKPLINRHIDNDGAESYPTKATAIQHYLQQEEGRQDPWWKVGRSPLEEEGCEYLFNGGLVCSGGIWDMDCGLGTWVDCDGDGLYDGNASLDELSESRR